MMAAIALTLPVLSALVSIVAVSTLASVALFVNFRRQATAAQEQRRADERADR